MRIKTEINVAAATFPHRFGAEMAAKLNFTKAEHFDLWWFAVSPEYVKSKFDDLRRIKLLEIISRQPEDAIRLVMAIRRNRDRKKDGIIRNVLLKNNNWKLPDIEVAALVCKKLNQEKLAGKALQKRVGNVKKIRQGLAKKYPATKGKNAVA